MATPMTRSGSSKGRDQARDTPAGDTRSDPTATLVPIFYGFGGQDDIAFVHRKNRFVGPAGIAQHYVDISYHTSELSKGDGFITHLRNAPFKSLIEDANQRRTRYGLKTPLAFFYMQKDRTMALLQPDDTPDSLVKKVAYLIGGQMFFRVAPLNRLSEEMLKRDAFWDKPLDEETRSIEPWRLPFPENQDQTTISAAVTTILPSRVTVTKPKWWNVLPQDEDAYSATTFEVHSRGDITEPISESPLLEFPDVPDPYKVQIRSMRFFADTESIHDGQLLLRLLGHKAFRGLNRLEIVGSLSLGDADIHEWRKVIPRLKTLIVERDQAGKRDVRGKQSSLGTKSAWTSMSEVKIGNPQQQTITILEDSKNVTPLKGQVIENAWTFSDKKAMTKRDSEEKKRLRDATKKFPKAKELKHVTEARREIADILAVYSTSRIAEAWDVMSRVHQISYNGFNRIVRELDGDDDDSVREANEILTKYRKIKAKQTDESAATPSLDKQEVVKDKVDVKNELKKVPKKAVNDSSKRAKVLLSTSRSTRSTSKEKDKGPGLGPGLGQTPLSLPPLPPPPPQPIRKSPHGVFSEILAERMIHVDAHTQVHEYLLDWIDEVEPTSWISHEYLAKLYPHVVERWRSSGGNVFTSQKTPNPESVERAEFSGTYTGLANSCKELSPLDDIEVGHVYVFCPECDAYFDTTLWPNEQKPFLLSQPLVPGHPCARPNHR